MFDEATVLSLSLSNFGYFAFSALVNLVTSFSLGLLVLYRNPNGRLSRIFALFALSIAAWSSGYVLWQLADTAETALFWSRGLMFGAIFTAFTYFHFVLVLLGVARQRRVLLYSVYGIGFVFLLLNFTPWFVSHVEPELMFPFWPKPGMAYHAFLAVWFGSLIYAGYLLIKHYRDSDDEVFRQQIKYVFTAMLIVFVSGSTNYYLWYGIPVPPYANVLVSLHVAVLAYAVLRYHLFNLRIVTTEIFVGALVVFVALRLVLSDTMTDAAANGSLLLATAFVGYLLIRTARSDARRQNKLEILTEDLRKANARLKELDRQKSEFVSIASHQLRSPLTAMKGYASMLLEGEYGTVPGKIRDVVANIYEASNNMTTVVEDFLNVSRIEQGRMEYHTSEFDLGELAAEVTEEMQPTAQSEGLELTFGQPDTRCNVVADEGKTRQIVRNLIDNAIKYTPEGSITVRAYSDGADACVSVSDTGVGMSRETLDRLFRKFSRSEEANEVNVSGTGLGLYVGKQMAEAQGGSIEAQSPGEGQGSTFTLRLPCAADNTA